MAASHVQQLAVRMALNGRKETALTTIHPPVRRLLGAALTACLLAWASSAAHAQLGPGAAPNIVQVSPLIYTSGQPTAQALAGLGTQGFEAVIYLAPPTVGEAVSLNSESTILRTATR
jgi:hypothetical protein